MTKPNFFSMNQTELRAYVLAHRDDHEAFYTLVDKLKTNPQRKLTLQDIESLPEVLEEIKQKKET